MSKLLATSAALAFAFGAAAPALAQTVSEADCRAQWEQADVEKKGSLSGESAQPYLDAAGNADADNDGALSQQEFMSACVTGAFKDVGSDKDQEEEKSE